MDRGFTEQTHLSATSATVSKDDQPRTKRNLFVATRLGQVRFETIFIKEHNLPAQENDLVIMVTKNDLALLENIQINVSENIFGRVSVAILPNFPTSRRGAWRHFGVYKAMKKSLGNLYASLPNVEIALHLHHVDTYYPFFERILNELDLRLLSKTILEEGLSSYKRATDQVFDVYGHEKTYRISKRDARKNLRSIQASLSKNTVVCFVKDIFRLLATLIFLIADCISLLTGWNAQRALCSVKDALLPHRVTYGIVNEFDYGYLCFPEKVENLTAFTIKDVRKLPYPTPDALPNDITEHLSELPTTIFAGQRYGDARVFYDALFRVFSEMEIESLYFKVHPRENPEQVESYILRAKSRYPNLSVVLDDSLSSIPIEDLLATGHFSKLIALTSSCLLYASLIAPNVESISIGKYFYGIYNELCAIREGTLPSLKNTDVFERDLKLLESVAPEIPQFEPNSTIKQVKGAENR